MAHSPAWRIGSRPAREISISTQRNRFWWLGQGAEIGLLFYAARLSPTSRSDSNSVSMRVATTRASLCGSAIRGSHLRSGLNDPRIAANPAWLAWTRASKFRSMRPAQPDQADKHRTGADLRHRYRRRGLASSSTRADHPSSPANGTTMEIRVLGNSYEAFLNGFRTTAFNNTDAARGTKRRARPSLRVYRAAEPHGGSLLPRGAHQVSRGSGSAVRILHLTTEFPPVIYGGLGTAVGGWVNASAHAGVSVAVQLVEGPLVLGGASDAYGGHQHPAMARLSNVSRQDGVTFFQCSWSECNRHRRSFGT